MIPVSDFTIAISSTYVVVLDFKTRHDMDYGKASYKARRKQSTALPV